MNVLTIFKKEEVSTMPRKKTTNRRSRTSKDRNEGGVKKTTHEAIEGVKGGVSNVVEGIKKAFD